MVWHISYQIHESHFINRFDLKINCMVGCFRKGKMAAPSAQIMKANMKKLKHRLVQECLVYDSARMLFMRSCRRLVDR